MSSFSLFYIHTLFLQPSHVGDNTQVDQPRFDMICYDIDLGSLFNSSMSSEETAFLEGELFLSSSTLNSSKHLFLL